MDADRDAICTLMERGLDDFYSKEEGAFDRAEALWGKWCDPERVECPSCSGLGHVYDGYNDAEMECEACYGTGKVRPPTPTPPPKPPRSRYKIVNGGVLGGWYRVVVLKDDVIYWVYQSNEAYDEAWKMARALVAAAERDEEPQTVTDPEFICPFCNAPYTEEMIDALHGTCWNDTCDKLCIVIKCAACEKTVYVKGEHGETVWDWQEGRVTVERSEIQEALKSPREWTEYDDCFSFDF
jgi:hypothetical protein